MIDDVDDIAAHYDADPEREDLRLREHQLEYDLTWRYLNQYLPTDGSVLEIGAGTGRYSEDLAKRGYAVTAVDLSAALIERATKRLAERGVAANARFVVADARDLSDVNERNFDAVLMFGPLYHLVVKADRKLALQEAFDRLRGSGIIFSSFLSRLGVMGDLLKRMPHWIEDQREVRSLLERGKRPDEYPRGGFRGYFAHVSEIAPLHETIGFQTLAVAAVEPAISSDDDSYNKLQGERRDIWLDLFCEISQEHAILGASRHLLYVGKKPVG